MQHENWIISCPFTDNTLGHQSGISHNETATPHLAWKDIKFVFCARVHKYEDTSFLLQSETQGAIAHRDACTHAHQRAHTETWSQTEPRIHEVVHICGAWMHRATRAAVLSHVHWSVIFTQPCTHTGLHTEKSMTLKKASSHYLNLKLIACFLKSSRN